VSDLFTFDLEDGLASGRCPICFALERHIERWLGGFWREGRYSPSARKRFYAGGGFCRKHAWLFHELASAGGSGAAIADVYGRLAEQDVKRLEELVAGASRLRARQPSQALGRSAQCVACVEATEAAPRKADFLLQLLASSTGRQRYERSSGPCYDHLLMLVDASGKRADLSRFLLEDWHRRLAEMRHRLAEYDRKRDHHYAAQRNPDDERSWTDVIKLYVGEVPSRS